MSEFVFLSGGMVLPRPAVDAVLDLEHAGHRLTLDGADILVEAGKGLTVDPDQLAALRRWKPHARMLLTYQADDSHLYANQAPEVQHRRTA